jgi:hypothetical protein
MISGRMNAVPAALIAQPRLGSARDILARHAAMVERRGLAPRTMHAVRGGFGRAESFSVRGQPLNTLTGFPRSSC